MRIENIASFASPWYFWGLSFCLLCCIVCIVLDLLYNGNAVNRNTENAVKPVLLMEPPENTKKKVTLYLSEEQHRAGRARFASAIYKGSAKFQTLLLELYERWLAGEFDVKRPDRTITAAESEEDREILRIVHRPANRAEVLAGTAIKRYLELLNEEKTEG